MLNAPLTRVKGQAPKPTAAQQSSEGESFMALYHAQKAGA